MKSKDFLFIISLVVGVVSLFLWVCRMFIDIPLIYPLSFLIVQYLLLFLYKKIK